MLKIWHNGLSNAELNSETAELKVQLVLLVKDIKTKAKGRSYLDCHKCDFSL